jgi:fructokinase
MLAEQSTGERQVLSMGEFLVDFIVADGATSLASARAFVARPGGAPANVAVALARLGISSAFCGIVGADPFGDMLRHELGAEGVDTSRLRQIDEAATTLAYAWKDHRGDGHFWLLRAADTFLNPNDAEAAAIHHLAALVIGSVTLAAQPSRSALQRAIELACSADVPVVFDVNLRPTVWSYLPEAVRYCEEVASRSRLVKLSLDDGAGLFGAGISPQSAIERILHRGPEIVVLTDGERGCWFASQTETAVTFVPAYAVEALEPTGAGDAFLAALIDRELASDWAPPTTADIRFAAAAGALATTKQGAWDGLPNRRQLEAFLQPE